MRAYVLIQTSPGTGLSVKRALDDIPEITEVVPTAGPYDFIVTTEVATSIRLQRVLMECVHAIDGVVHVIPCVTDEVAFAH